LELHQFIPPVCHEFYCSFPNADDAGRRKDEQEVVIVKDEDVNAEETGTAVLETDSK
jgi:hypothetical protein